MRMGRQDYWLGAPILPEELAALPYKERTQRVTAAIEALGPDPATEEPNRGDAELAARVEARAARSASGAGLATLVEVLHARADLGDEARRLLELVDEPAAKAPGDGPEARWLTDLAALLR